MPLIDTHAHLDDDAFDADRAEVIAPGPRGRLASRRGGRLHGRIQRRLRAIGRPGFAVVRCGRHSAKPHSRGCARRLGANCRVGRRQPGGGPRGNGARPLLGPRPLAVQQDYFDRHLRLSQQLDLPFIVHTRESDAEVLAMLREARARGPLRGVMHSFTGTAETAAECVELGMYISFAGMATFKNAQNLRDVAKTVPADRIVGRDRQPLSFAPPVARPPQRAGKRRTHGGGAGRGARANRRGIWRVDDRECPCPVSTPQLKAWP